MDTLQDGVNTVLARLQELNDADAVRFQVERVLRGKSHTTSFVLLVLDYLSSKHARLGGASFFGKSLVAINGFDLISFALERKERDDLIRAVFGLMGTTACLAAVLGPERHTLLVLQFALIKLLLGFFIAKSTTTAAGRITPATQATLEFARHHARSGVAVALFSLLLMWRNRKLDGEHGENKMAVQLEELIAVVKDQNTRLDAIVPADSTPKKYIAN